MSHLIIRADAGIDIGFGHIMRCLALGQNWRDHEGPVTFIGTSLPQSIETRIIAKNMRFEHIPTIPDSDNDAKYIADFAIGSGASWIVVDGYQFDSSYQKMLKKAGLNVLVLDDLGKAGPYYADIILNQNINAHHYSYKNRESYTQLLIGTTYALLRKEFLDYSGLKSDTPLVAKNILVTFGGVDPERLIKKVIRALRRVKKIDLNVLIICGNINKNSNEFKSEIGERDNFKIITNPSDMPSLMNWADLAITAGGSTSWELAFMGVPNLIINFAKNQVSNSEQLHDSGLAMNLGDYKRISDDHLTKKIEDLVKSYQSRKRMKELGQKAVDGKGVIRVIDAMKDYSSIHSL